MADDMISDAFPRLQAYVKTLPNGLSSYPECRGKASLFSIALALHPVARFPAGAPERLRVYFDNPPPANQWVPELDYCLFSILMAEIHGWDQVGMRRFRYGVMSHINNSAMYGLLFRFL